MNALVCGESNISPRLQKENRLLNLPHLKSDNFKVVCFLQVEGLSPFIHC